MKIPAVLSPRWRLDATSGVIKNLTKLFLCFGVSIKTALQIELYYLGVNGLLAPVDSQEWPPATPEWG